MRSELFRIPMEWGGAPVFGVGVLLALWIVGAAVLMTRHAARHGRDQDFWGYLGPVAIGAVAIVLAPRFAPEGIPIRGYGVMLLLAVSTGLVMAVRRAQANGVSADTIFSLAFWMFLAGIAGARLFFVAEYWDASFAGKPWGEVLFEVVRFTEGGLVVYGSLIGASLAFVWFTWRHKIPMLALADVVAPSLVAGLAIGRLGCLMNGCCYGGECDRPWAVTFPEGSPPYVDQLIRGEFYGFKMAEFEEDGVVRLRVVSADASTGLEPGATVTAIGGAAVGDLYSAAAEIGRAYERGEGLRLRLASGEEVRVPAAEPRTRSLPVHPTQIYSAVNAALLAWLLWAYYPSRRRDGEVLAILLTIYPVSRYLLEVIRTDETAFMGTGLSISQNVSLLILAAAAALWVWLLSRPPQRAFGNAPAAC
ncbi:Prolipoprotein diacylglyceryl transferase [Pseudobythopirellula maris]|uniref:Phosphatidylglycerol--prolipoprotein diacylglyceryl transferase n=1 Tax=Pseudobythopirellula maris TaxID=2527991 RepID=A0A5C5ZVQ7_9BACT|nr:prolipoprotein diacylglyceryl transferase [Pseudobythopirellula maris]TWT91138.1 Prolipoprotein diacylglyceryl transferase [Pseudobythopirellula maris]